MDFYGVGVRLGGKGENSIFMNCIKHKCWYMGFSQGFNERYDKIIEQVQYGDIVFAKSYLVANNQREAEMRIEAIGIVTGKDLPEDIAKLEAKKQKIKEITKKGRKYELRRKI